MVNKKIIVMIMVAMMVVGTIAVGAYAEAKPQAAIPGVVGEEHLKAVGELSERYNNGEFELDYWIKMEHAENYWIVELWGESDACQNQLALGIYTHAPTEEDIEFLWSTRVSKYAIYEALEEYNYCRRLP